MPFPNVSGDIRLSIEFFFKGTDFERLEDLSKEVKDRLVSQIVISLLDEPDITNAKLTQQALKFMAIRMPYKHRDEIIPFLNGVLSEVNNAISENTMPDGDSVSELSWNEDINEITKNLREHPDFWAPALEDLDAIALVEDKSGVVVPKQPEAAKPGIFMSAFKAIVKPYLFEDYQGVPLDGPLLQAARLAYADATVNDRFQERSLDGVRGHYNKTTVRTAEASLQGFIDQGVSLEEIDPVRRDFVWY